MAHRQQPPPRESGEKPEGAMTLAHPVDALRGLVGRMEGLFERPLDILNSVFESRLEIEQTAKELIVRARLPGYSKEDLTVDLTDDSVTVRGVRGSSSQTRRHGSSAEQTERSSFTQSVTLPAAIRPEGAKASFKGDRLEIRLPRAKEARVRRLGLE